MTPATEHNPVHETPTNTPIAMTGTWFGRWGNEAYELRSGLPYAQALRVATAWALRDLDESGVEVDVDIFAEGNEWIIDVVAFETAPVVTQLGSRRARIDSSGRLVA